MISRAGDSEHRCRKPGRRQIATDGDGRIRPGGSVRHQVALVSGDNLAQPGAPGCRHRRGLWRCPHIHGLRRVPSTPAAGGGYVCQSPSAGTAQRKGLMPEWGETDACGWLDAQHESPAPALPG